MLRSINKMIHSLTRLIGLIVLQLYKVTTAVFFRDREAAGEHARYLYLTLHEDLLNSLVAVQRVIPIWSKPRPNIDRILIVKLDRIGDMVTTTPVFDALREKYPNARLDIVGHPVSLSLLEEDDRIAERIHYRSWLYHSTMISFPGLRSIVVVLKLIWRRYPLVVYLRGSIPMLALGLVSRLAATKFVVAEPVVDRYLRAVAKVCGPVGQYPPRLRVSAQSMEFARSLLRGPEAGSHTKIVIHPTASSPAKTWPLDRYAALADQLNDRHDCQVHFLGSPSDVSTLKRIETLARRGHHYHSSLKLSQVAAVIAEADLFVGNDSGLSHIAAAVHTPAVVLWGPANLSMARPTTQASECIIIYHDLTCRDQCPEFRCNHRLPYECLTRTSVEQVVAATFRQLETKTRDGTAGRRTRNAPKNDARNRALEPIS